MGCQSRRTGRAGSDFYVCPTDICRRGYGMKSQGFVSVIYIATTFHAGHMLWSYGAYRHVCSLRWVSKRLPVCRPLTGSKFWSLLIEALRIWARLLQNIVSDSQPPPFIFRRSDGFNLSFPTICLGYSVESSPHTYTGAKLPSQICWRKRF